MGRRKHGLISVFLFFLFFCSENNEYTLDDADPYTKDYCLSTSLEMNNLAGILIGR